MYKRIWFVCGVLIITLSLRTWLTATPQVPQRRPLSEFPAQLGAYSQRSSETIASDVQGVLKADDYIVRNYFTADGHMANVFVAYYKSQLAGESMHSPKNCLPSSGWEPVVNDRIQVAGPTGPVEVNRYVVEKNGQRSLILYWYHSGNRVYASEYWGKAYLIADTARTGRRDGAIARVVVPLGRDRDLQAATAEGVLIASSIRAALPPFIGAAE
jgi:EpsI family protein